MRLNRVLVLLQNAAFCKESFVFTCLIYKNVQRFQNGPVQEFYGLKASQMEKLVLVVMNTHMLKKLRIFVNRISKVRQTSILNEATSVVTWYLSLTLV